MSAHEELSRHLKELSVEDRRELVFSTLTACQPQEGSPPTTLTKPEGDDLMRAHPEINVIEDNAKDNKNIHHNNHNNGNLKIDICNMEWPEKGTTTMVAASPQDCDQQVQIAACPQDGDVVVSAPPQDGSEEGKRRAFAKQDSLDWHGAPRFHKQVQLPRSFRNDVRNGTFKAPTNGVCPGFLQCNLVVLPQGRHAFDFLLFCQRNPKSCPLIEVCDVGSPFPEGVAEGADLRTDVPMYCIYRDGKLVDEVSDATPYWPEDSVAFLIGCSFSYDGALMDAGIPLKSAEQGKNVPMYRTNLKCRSAGSLTGNMVVSMKPIPALQVSKHVEITSKYAHAHGGPVSIGSASAIGIKDIDNPEWGDQIDIAPHEVPVFHACGVTPQSVLMDSKVPFAITHKAGYMFVTDLPSDMGV